MGDQRQHEEQHAGTHRGDDDGAGNVAFRVARFLGQGGHRVETEEGQAEHRGPGHQRREAGLAAIAEEGCGEVDGRVEQALAGHGQEHGDEDQLGDDDQVAHARHRADAEDVQHRHQPDGGDHEDPGRHLGEGDVEEQADHQVVDHRQEQVIQQQRPAGEKAHAGAEAQAGVGVRRAGDGVAADHEAVRQRGEDHRQQGHHVGQGGAPAGHLGDHAVGGEDGQRHHVDQAEEHQGGQPEYPPQGRALSAVGVFVGQAAAVAEAG
ncbi:hypothetical protein D9M70_433350 [compost metagenome]